MDMKWKETSKSSLVLKYYRASLHLKIKKPQQLRSTVRNQRGFNADHSLFRALW